MSTLVERALVAQTLAVEEMRLNNVFTFDSNDLETKIKNSYTKKVKYETDIKKYIILVCRNSKILTEKQQQKP
jgi:hypothetical protein